MRMTVQKESNLPWLRGTATSQQLIVDGEPFLMLAGELQNSSFSSVEYMQNVWSNLKAANYNTILASVAWEQIEPTEGVFDFQWLDQQISAARALGLRLVLLWFGTFKNGLSTYTPPWVKTNPGRFPRAKLRTETADEHLGTADVLSIFNYEARTADSNAFKAFMQHLKDVDEHHTTVLMVQVQNEVGLLGDSRDRSNLANAAFDAMVPSELLHFIRNDWEHMNSNFQSTFKGLREDAKSKSLPWKDLSCDPVHQDELFMAYHCARYINEVASAGRAVYPIPLYTNVWQNYGDEDRDTNTPQDAAGGDLPGDYPSGGGVANVLDIWQTFAPSLDFIAPDIYLNDYPKTCGKYRHRGQPLFIPEQRRDEYGARRTWSAMGTHQAIGAAPFGIDTVIPGNDPYGKHYGLLAKVSKPLLSAQERRNASVGFFFDDLFPDGRDLSPPVHALFGNWKLIIERSHVFGHPSAGYGMVIYDEPDRFLLVGFGFQVTFESTNEKACFTGILRFEEKDVDENGLRTVRMFNGDETRSGRSAVMPSEDPDYGDFPISITIPGSTGLALCQPYALADD